MTEPFPFGVQDETPVAYEEEGKDKKPLIALGAVAAVALGAGAFFLLSGGDAAEDTFVVPTAARPAAAAPVAPVTKPVTLPARSTVQLGRNPFRALYTAPAAGGGGGSTVTTDSAATTPTTVTPVPGGNAPIIVVTGGETPTSPPTSGSTTPPTTSTPPQSAPVSSRSTVKLTGVSTKSGEPVGTFVLDGKTLTGKADDVLAGKLLVIAIQQDATGGWFANLQVGDGSPFEVHERQEVVVQ